MATKITTLTGDNIRALALMANPAITLGATVATFDMTATEALAMVQAERDARRSSQPGKHNPNGNERGAGSYRALDAVLRKLRKAAA